jgi:hypothetical protein
MKPIHVYKLAVYLKDDAEDLNADEIQEAIKTELDGTYYLSVFDIEYQGVVKTNTIEKEGN